ncbi:MAG: type II toxin-antitoxin system PemK/MazF family toxin [Sulfuricurvum sp.]|nr:type II toxin-antitoxin system PemK/MazF family toxin [Sulfuricurvum sp.]MDP3022048.1 type II toxin-antitoxin system PemK/MazF family toxin [Sulfuricurvum sp.]
MIMFQQYSIVLVNLDPTVGSEIQKTRPCVIISPDEMNQSIRTLLIAPMTSTSKPYPSRIIVNENSTIALDQIRCIDKSRIIKSVGSIPTSSVSQLKTALKEMLVD